MNCVPSGETLVTVVSPRLVIQPLRLASMATALGKAKNGVVYPVAPERGWPVPERSVTWESP